MDFVDLDFVSQAPALRKAKRSVEESLQHGGRATETEELEKV